MNATASPRTTSPAGPGPAAALAAWFGAHARDLPWRRERTPYRVWISEIMLQQTRVAAVVPRYERWFARFPDVTALADAHLDEVLAEWEGLGYYRRARALHRTARIVARELGGEFPDDEEGLRALPGIGSYTAAAIAALAFGRRTVALDSGVRRLAARLAGSPDASDETLRRSLLPLVSPADPAPGAEALVELAATVCTPRRPACHACPLSGACLGRLVGPERFPARRERGPVPTRVRYALVYLRNGAVWLRRRPEDGLLGGLWGPPQREEVPEGRALEPLSHAYSHFRLSLVPVLVEGAPHPEPDGGEARWVAGDEIGSLPLSVVDRRLVRRLADAGALGAAP